MVIILQQKSILRLSKNITFSTYVYPLQLITNY